MRNENYPTLAYALGLAAVAIVGAVVMVELKWRFLDWLWNGHSFWAPVITVFAIALLPWQIFRYARRKNDPVPKSVESKPAERDDSEGFW
jgi:hypothetical protein